MVAIVTGEGVGLERSSRSVLGSFGQWGSAAMGRAQENVYVNAATGNLVIQKHDDFLKGLGSNSPLSRTYNSLGDLSDDNGDNWRVNQSKVDGLTGTVNTVGSTVTRTARDGTKSVYTWNASISGYVSKDGEGAHDLITYDSGAALWTWMDSGGVRFERYEAAYGGRLGSESVRGGSYTGYHYNGAGQLYRIWASGSAYTEFTYSGNNITTLVTASNGTLTRTYYGYDGSNRLTSVTVDLTPTDHSIADGNTYVTTYTYDGSSKRVATITQKDGSSLAIGYTQVGSDYRVTSLVQAASSGVTRTTTLSYNTATRVTTITDPQGQATAMEYDPDGQLLSVTAAGRTTSFTYDANGNVLTITEPSGEVTTFGYNDNGARIYKRDHANNVTEWSYNGWTDQVLTETRYRTPDPDGASGQAASDGVTARNVYDAFNKHRFSITAEGRVTEFRYDVYGQVTSVIAYGDHLYTTAGNPSDTAMDSWVTGLADKSNTRRTDTTYDWRGNVATVTSYGKVLTGGAGDTAATTEISKTHYVYDANGRLLSRRVEGNDATETFVYDGLGRLIGSTDMLGDTTTIAFNDAAGQTIVTLDNGATTTSVYNLAGELISTSVAGSGVTTATSGFKYDSLGRLRISIDPAGVRTYFFYDAAGFKAAEIAADGGMVEYKYNADGQVIATVAYATKVTSGDLATLVDGSNNPTAASLDSVRPGVHANDRWSWNVYDAAGRLVQTIDGTGVATSFTYDGASQLISTKVHANALSVAGYKTTPPTSVQTPTAHFTDRVTRNFYDDDGNLEGTLDAAGYLTRIVYDAAGRKVETIAYATLTSSAYWASGTFAQLLTSAGTTSADVRTRFVYDGRGLLRGTVDALGGVTSFAYDAAGRVTKAVQHAVLYAPTGVPDFADLQSWITSNAGANDRITRTIYDAKGQPVYLVDAEGFVTKKEYDFAGRVTKDIRYAVAVSASDGMTPASMAALLPGTVPSTAAVTTYQYDSVGRLTDVTDAEGGVTHSVYDVLGQVTDVTRGFGTDDATTTHYVYDNVGRLVTETAAYGQTYATATRYLYDAFGQPTHVTVAYGGSDGVTTHYTYDAVGRVKAETRAYEEAPASTTNYTYDAFGQVTEVVEAFGTADAATTHYTRDNLGRIKTEIRGFGESYASTTAHTYDAFGQVKTTTRAHGSADASTTVYDYDRLGRLVTTTVPLDGSNSAVTTNTYDSFGNLVKLTDPRLNSAYYYYDKLGRQTLQVDPEGYVTATTYTILGDIAKVRRYHGQTTGATVTTPPNLSTAGTYADTIFTRDRLGRVTATTDAENKTESYTLNALGQRTRLTNKLGGVTDYTYDKLGRLTQESQAISWTRPNGAAASTTIVNKFEYDARGNRTKTIEAFGQPEQRTTTFTYDKLNRLKTESGDPVWILLSDHNTEQQVTPTESIDYDRRGNIVRTTDANGYQTWHWYDDLDRKIAQVDATGTLSTWTYDLNGNVLSAKVWETPVASPNLAAAPTGAGAHRETTYTYDRNNRRLSASVAGLRSAKYVTSSGTYTDTTGPTGTITTRTNYDANGNVVEEIDGEGNSAYHYYDKLGRKKATVDREGYVTTYALDAEGNVLTERRYATHRVGLTATNFSTPDPTANDRVTTFTYDKNGRRLTETRTGVVAWSVNETTGALVAAATNAKITYTYNELGQVLTRKEAAEEGTSQVTAYSYDKGGRLQFTTAPSYLDHTGATVTRVTEYWYDGLNNVTRERVGLAAESLSTDHNTSYTYGAQGRLATMTDANGFVRTYAYDRAGNLMRERYTRTKSDGSTVNEANVFKYDALNRQIFQARATQSGATWVAGDSQQLQYNRYGEISAKGVNGLWQETFQYDKGGRLVRTTAGDGTPRFFVHDKNGNVTLTVSSAGANLSIYGTVDDLIPALGTIPSPVTGMVLTLSTYNKRGDAIGTVEEDRNHSGVTTDLIAFSTFNAFGEVTSESRYRGSTLITTNYTYNTLGKLIEKKNPEVNITAENGAVTTNYRPTETYYYDLSGRLVGTDDANGNRTTRVLLAGTGYGGEDGLVAAEHHADGGVKRTGYDVFGDARKLTNEIGKIEERTYDKMGHVLAITRPSGLVESYAYDQLGQRTQHWNSYFGSSSKELTDYDAQGRIVRTVDYEGEAITHAYAWNGSLTTSGLETFGGWTKTTGQYGAYTATENTDIFGRTIGKTDFGGITYTYTYNRAGWLTVQTSNEGQSLTYTYFNTGRVATMTDASQSSIGLTSLTSYVYDEVGNKVSESFSATRSGVTTTFQSATSVYDNMNRRISVSDTARGGRTSTYQYDAVGNVRFGEGLWYKYDAMNRVVRQGHFVGTAGSGAIERGTDMLYDAAGQRVRVITTGNVTENVTNWYVPAFWVPPQSGGGYYEYGPFLLHETEIVEYYKEPGNTWDDFARDIHGNVGMLQFYNGENGYWCMSGERWVDEWSTDGYWDGDYYINGPHTAPTDKIEIYTYNDDGYLTGVSRTHKHLQGGGEAAPSPWTYDIRDALGRVTEHFEYLPGTSTPSYREANTYDKRSNLLTKWTGMKRAGTLHRYSETTFSYLEMVQGGWGLWFATGAYQGGAVTGTTTKSWEANSWSLATKDQLTGIHFNIADSSVRNDLDWRDSARIAYEYSTFGGNTYTSTHAYDKNGYLTSVAVADGSPITKYLLTDARGQMIQRKTRSGASPGASGLAYFQNPPSGGGFWGSDQTVFRFDGYHFGEAETGSYQQGIEERYLGRDPSGRQGFFITPQSQPSASMTHTVRAGETLATIAAQIWGDASLWYVIAEANGLSGSGQVAAGQTLIVPNKAVRKHYNADTFRPYDSAEIVGPTGAAKPKVDRNGGNCGTAGQILKMIVAVAVTAMLGPAGGWAMAAFKAAVGNVVSQGFAMATGIQDGFSWKEVGLSAIGGGVSNKLSGAFTGLGEVGGAVARGAAGNAITQGIGVATGLQDRMDWGGVAMAGVMGGVAGKLLGSAKFLPNANGNLRLGMANMAGALAASGARSMIDGSSFGDNLKSLLPSVIGNTVGGMLQRKYGAPPVAEITGVKDFAAAVSGACFVAGTLVHTRTGLREIESIRAGDWVASRNESSEKGSLNWRKVIETYQHTDKAILHLTMLHPSGAQETLSATPEHPFFVNGLWTKAADLAAGDYLELKGGDRSQLLEVTRGDGLHTVYNFAVENDHTYFVGVEGIWAHNTYAEVVWLEGQSKGKFSWEGDDGNAYEMYLGVDSEHYTIGYTDEGAYTAGLDGKMVGENAFRSWTDYQSEATLVGPVSNGAQAPSVAADLYHQSAMPGPVLYFPSPATYMRQQQAASEGWNVTYLPGHGPGRQYLTTPSAPAYRAPIDQMASSPIGVIAWLAAGGADASPARQQAALNAGMFLDSFGVGRAAGGGASSSTVARIAPGGGRPAAETAALRSEAARNIWSGRRILAETRPDLPIAERNSIIRSFDLESFRVERVTSPTTEYRYFDGLPDGAGLPGRWSTSQWISDPADRISILALPNNQATRAAMATLQPGSTVFRGTVAPQLRYGSNLTGGGLQTYNAAGPRAIFREIP